MPQEPPIQIRVNEPHHQTTEGEAVDIIDGPTVEAHVELAAKPSKFSITTLNASDFAKCS
jgi:hypothetical protein